MSELETGGPAPRPEPTRNGADGAPLDLRDERDEQVERDDKPSKPSSQRRRARDDDDGREREGGFSFSPARPSRKALTARADAEFNEAADAYESILDDLDVKDGKWSFTVLRVTPKEDPETGIPLEGTCGRFDGEVPTSEIIEERFGGGTYKVMIRGPRPGERPDWGLRDTVTVKIPGLPILPKRRGRPQQANGNGGQAGFGNDPTGIVERLTTASQEQLRTVIASLQAQPQANAGVTEIVSTLAKMLDPARGQSSMEAERRLREDERKQERADREEERKWEREQREFDRKREQEDRAAERERLKLEAESAARLQQIKLEAEVARAKAEATVAIAQAEANAKLQVAALQAQTAQMEKSMTLQIESMKAQSASERSFATELNRSTQEVQTKLLAISNDAAKSTQAFLLDQLKDARATSQVKDPKKDLLDTIDLVDRLRGGDNGDDDEPLVLKVMEKGFEGVGKIAPGLMAAAGVGVARATVTKREEARAQAQAEVEDGSIAVLENDGQQRRVRKLRKPQAPQKPGDPVIIDKDKLAVQAATAEDKVQPATPNDLIDFVLPSVPKHAQLDQEIVELLVKNIDFALQKNMEAKDIVEKIVLRFPTAVIMWLRDIDVDQMFAMLESLPNIQGWTITSLSGQDTMRKAHKILQSFKAP